MDSDKTSKSINQGLEEVQPSQDARLSASDATRRRLLKASAAAPLAATLTPNAAFALSSAVQCAANTENYSPVADHPEADKAVRRQATYFHRKRDRKSGPRTLVQIDGELYTESGRSVSLPDNKLHKRYDRGDDKYLLEYFDVDGEGILGSGPFRGKRFQHYAVSHEATPLTVSCMTSINPHP